MKIHPLAVSFFIFLQHLNPTAWAAALLVPKDFKTIQAAIDATRPGDSILVSAGKYNERISLKPGLTVRSAGDDAKGKLGLQRAEATIIDGTGGNGPGVTMAAGATLDGFTVTGVGKYDEALWQKHHATQGNLQKHEHIGAEGTPGIAARHDCTVANNIIHHIGYTGIAITGAEDRRVSPRIVDNITYRNMGGGIGSMKKSTARIEGNLCFENFYAGIGHNDASPIVIDNSCYRNIRAGIGISEGSRPVVRGNRCHHNRRAGIGIRTGADTQPVVEDNDCHENDMAGIGTKEGARPILRGNRCWKNKLAGIGARDKAQPMIIENECFENTLAGIGIEHEARALISRNLCRKNKTTGIGVQHRAEATVLGNRCLENAKVAIGVGNGASAHIAGNQLTRAGGMPPLIAILKGSSAIITGNTFTGGGVAGVLVQGSAHISKNRFEGNGPHRGGPPNFAVWAHAGSEVEFHQNEINRWRHALFTSGAKSVAAHHNRISQFLGTAILIQNAATPAHATHNTALTTNVQDESVTLTGPRGVVEENVCKAK